jgi:hypothetical protein
MEQKVGEECKCEVPLDEVPKMADWLEQEQEGECRPCALAVLIADYQKALTEAGRQDLAERFAGIVDDDDPVKVTAVLMDKIKESVTKELRERLLLLDCMAQTSQEIIEEGGV